MGLVIGLSFLLFIGILFFLFGGGSTERSSSERNLKEKLVGPLAVACVPGGNEEGHIFWLVLRDLTVKRV